MAVSLVSVMAEICRSSAYVGETTLFVIQQISSLLALPLSDISRLLTVTDIVFYAPWEMQPFLAPLLAVAFLGANSLIWGFAAEGYLKLLASLRQRIRRDE